MIPRQLPNGDLEFPRLGHEPAPADSIPNYERDKANPWIFHLVLDPCKFREVRETRMPCGKVSSCFWCVLKLIPVSPMYCASCTEQESP